MNALRTFLMHHLPWVILVLIGGIGIHAYMQEHDQRLFAEQKIAVDEQQVKVLQDSINANNQAIASLQSQIQQRDAANARVIDSLLKAKQQAVTPQQQVTTLQTEAKLPEPIVSISGTPDFKLPLADVQPLFSAISDGQMAIANLTTCQADLTDQKQINAKQTDTITDQTKQLAAKDDQIKILSKKPKFWTRVGDTMRKVGIGIGIGAVLGAHGL